MIILVIPMLVGISILGSTLLELSLLNAKLESSKFQWLIKSEAFYQEVLQQLPPDEQSLTFTSPSLTCVVFYFTKIHPSLIIVTAQRTRGEDSS